MRFTVTYMSTYRPDPLLVNQNIKLVWPNGSMTVNALKHSCLGRCTLVKIWEWSMSKHEINLLLPNTGVCVICPPNQAPRYGALGALSPCAGRSWGGNVVINIAYFAFTASFGTSFRHSDNCGYLLSSDFAFTTWHTRRHLNVSKKWTSRWSAHDLPALF